VGWDSVAVHEETPFIGIEVSKYIATEAKPFIWGFAPDEGRPDWTVLPNVHNLAKRGDIYYRVLGVRGSNQLIQKTYDLSEARQCEAI